MTNTGIADGAVTALSRMSRRATPPAAWQFAAIWAKSDCNYDKWMWNRFKTIRSHGNEISQFAYEAVSKLISRNRSQLTCDQVQGSPQPKDAGSGTTVVSGG